MHRIQFGIDILLTLLPDWKSNNIALVTNHAATTSQFVASHLAFRYPVLNNF